MAFLRETCQVLALPRSFLLLAIVLFSLTWSANSVVNIVATYHKDLDGDCPSSTTADEPSEVNPETRTTFWFPQQVIEQHEFPSDTKMDNTATLTEKSSTSDPPTSQPDKSANEPVLSVEKLSDTTSLSKSNSEETLITEESSETQSLNGETSSNSEESVTLSKVDSEVTSSRGSTNSPTTRSFNRPPTCCHSAQSYPFADILSEDPCKLLTRGGIGKKIFADSEPKVVKEVYDYLITSIELLKRIVDNTLNYDVLNVCREVAWPPVARIPTQQDLELLGNGEILFLYYSSLLNHTAHLHHMVSQLQNYDRTCSRRSIHVSAREMAFDIRKVTCFLRLFILAVYDEYEDESFEKPAKEVLEVSLCDERACSRRAIYDCQVVSSLNDVLFQLKTLIEKPDPIETMKKLKPDIQRRCRSVLNNPEL